MSHNYVIENIELRIVRMNLVVPFRASTHGADELNHILVRASGRGPNGNLATGWGEVSAPNDPYYIGETVEGAWHMLRDFFIPKVLGKPWQNIEEFTKLYSVIKGNTFARAGLESAAWDLMSTLEGRSLASAIGGTRAEILSGVAMGMEEDKRLFELIDQYIEQGYRRVKLKIAPGKDVAVIEKVRKRYPNLPLMADANSAYKLADADTLRALDDFDVTMIEQPLAFDDFVDHAKLQSMLKTPICLDESIRSLNDAQTAIALGACKIVNIKVARVGGLLEAKRIHDACFASGIPVWCGGMHDYGVGRAANIAISTLPGFTIPGDISGSDKYFIEDIVDPQIVANRGAITVPTSPGNGYAVNEARVAEKTVRCERFGA
jgi:o-succinylbenzoate synthase